MNYESKVTKKMRAVDPNLTVAACCESDCQTTILVDKDEKGAGRATRCVACTMRMKLNGKAST